MSKRGEEWQVRAHTEFSFWDAYRDVLNVSTQITQKSLPIPP